MVKAVSSALNTVDVATFQSRSVVSGNYYEVRRCFV